MINEASVWNPNEADGVGRNVIINGDFDVWQRGVSFTADYTADRWLISRTGSTIVTTREDFALDQIDVPNNPRHYIRSVVTSVVGNSNFITLNQRIEGVRTFAGKTITVSFWARTIGADKNIAIELSQSFGTGGSPSTAVTGIGTTKILLTSEWTKYVVTILVPSLLVGSTLGTDSNDRLSLPFFFDAGSDFDSRTDTLGQQNGTFDIAQVQLEEGSVATGFERKSQGQILRECQRYYWKNGAKAEGYHYSVLNLTHLIGVVGSFPVTMREVPTMSVITDPTYEACSFHSLISSIGEWVLRVTKDGTTGKYRATAGIYEADAEL